MNRKGFDKTAIQRTEPQANVLYGHLRVIPYSEAIAEKIPGMDTLVSDEILVKNLEGFEPAQLEAFQDSLDHRHEIPAVLRLLQEIRLGEIFSLLASKPWQ